jgi:hypothetical protein
MEQFLNEVQAYARECGKEPSTVVQNFAGLSGTTWAKWVAGTSFPRADTIDRIRQKIASSQETEGTAA